MLRPDEVLHPPTEDDEQAMNEYEGDSGALVEVARALEERKSERRLRQASQETMPENEVTGMRLMRLTMG